MHARDAWEGRQDWFHLFLAYSAPEGKRPSQEALAERLGLSRDRVRNILERVRSRWERLLRAEVREQVGSEAEIDDEIRELRHLLGGQAVRRPGRRNGAPLLHEGRASANADTESRLH